jgi:hypothetical protein
MLLAAEHVADLQYFLMDAAKRYVVASGARVEDADELLSNAAALDYALLLSSEHADETLDDAAPVAETLRNTMTRAALAALDFADRMIEAPDDAFADFAGRHARRGGVFDVVRALQAGAAVTGDEVAFRLVTIASDVSERLRRTGGGALES